MNFYATKARGEDLFKGTRGKTAFKFSEIRASSYKVSNNELDKTFKGVLVKCKLNIPIKKSIRIYSKSIIVEPVGTKKMLLLGKYSNHFNVFGYENEQCAAILNDKILSQLAEIETLFQAKVFISFFPKSAHIAISTNHNYFEPNLKKEINIEQVERIYNEIIKCIMVVDIIDGLNFSNNDGMNKQLQNEK